jgi:23S rRNA (uracil1939-C5)-methyltransferase/tRNA (uracil-5-)-methyltransferase
VEDRPRKTPAKFKAIPFTYHQEVEMEIETLTNLGDGLGRVNGWVVFVPGALAGERILARIWHNSANFSRGDMVKVMRASPHRVEPRCPLFGTCGGCQYQNLAYPEQLRWKQSQVREAFLRIGGITMDVDACVPSPREWGYRTKLTPHFQAPGDDLDFPIGFLQAHSSRRVIDVPQCPIATEAVNLALTEIRSEVRARSNEFKRGATLLLRETKEGVTSDHQAEVTEHIGDLKLRFLAGDFFQNNPFILPAFVGHAINLAKDSGAKYLVDAYCGSGLFALSAAKHFESVYGIEVSVDAVNNAGQNATANGLTNCEFVAGSAEHVFQALTVAGADTAVIIDPPRKGCDEVFLAQLDAFSPRRIVYVSCAPDTQARDLRWLVAKGWKVRSARPFDLFPQTRHIESIVDLERV